MRGAPVGSFRTPCGLSPHPFFAKRTKRLDNMDTTSNQSGPKEIEQEFFSALLRSNHTHLDRILTDDFILIDVMRGAEIDKASLLGVIQSGALRFETIEPSEVRLRFYGKRGDHYRSHAYVRPFRGCAFYGAQSVYPCLCSARIGMALSFRPGNPDRTRCVIWRERIGRYSPAKTLDWIKSSRAGL